MESEKEMPAGSLPAHLEARVEAIIRAAEDHAESIQRDVQTQQRVAESEAQRHVTAARREAGALTDQRLRRLRELSDELTEQAEATLRQFATFSEALERATRELEAEGLEPQPAMPRAPAPPPAPARPAPVPTSALQRSIDQPTAPGEPPAPSLRRGPVAKRAAARTAELDAARLVAIEMAVDGRTRSDVEEHLREQFAIGGIESLLDDVFGEARGSTRAKWRGDD